MLPSIISRLYKLENESRKRGIPIVGPEKGAWIAERVKEHRPATVLELGTANGYSGCILGSEGAHVITLERDQQRTEEASNNFATYGVDAEIILGDAVVEIKKLKEPVDMIFIDFTKKQYINVLEDCLRLLKQGGVMIADNITFEGCQDFKEVVISDQRLRTSIIPIRDGLSYSIKLNV